MVQKVEMQDQVDRPSPEEIVDLLWERLDEDESGQVTPDELYNKLVQLDPSIAKDDMRELIFYVDKDGDGCLNKEEFEILVKEVHLF